MGTEVQQARVEGGIGCKVFVNDGNFQICVTSGVGPPPTILIWFTDGTGVALPVLTEFIGTVVIVHGQVLTVDFTPSENSVRYPAFNAQRRQVKQRRAAAAVAAGSCGFHLSKPAAETFATYAQTLKSLDPTLGLFAAYAYALAGNREGVASVMQWMTFDGPLLFDVGMLALLHGAEMGRTGGELGAAHAAVDPRMDAARCR